MQKNTMSKQMKEDRIRGTRAGGIMIFTLGIGLMVIAELKTGTKLEYTIGCLGTIFACTFGVILGMFPRVIER